MKNKDEIYYKVLESWSTKSSPKHSIEEIEEWIETITVQTEVRIQEISLGEDTFWFYDEMNGEILNRKRSFFQVKGIQEYENGELKKEQPIIIQPEVGYLGIICKEIAGTIHFLMQAKIEPGNINGVQISPTIQATKSNFTKMHGGKTPPYLEYFENAKDDIVLYDQIQSEQGARFLQKRNRNMIIYISDAIEVYPNYCWMTLRQIKLLMRKNNLVNMDTRTVISMINASMLEILQNKNIKELFVDDSMYKSFLKSDQQEQLIKIYHQINNFKMFHAYKEQIVPLNQLYKWKVERNGVFCKEPYPFKVQFYDIVIGGREVKRWTQPLFVAEGEMLLALLTRINHEGKRQFLIQMKHEIGYCDLVELAPSVQREANEHQKTIIDDLVDEIICGKEEGIILVDVKLSEEGGRFFHEENRNVIIELTDDILMTPPEGYFWVDFYLLGILLSINNCLNVQLRNLISLLLI